MSTAISSLANEFVTYPTDDQILKIKQGFFEHGGFPAVLGAIDGTQIQIEAPSTKEEAYVGRKEGHFINCQLICDANERFLDAVVKCPGSTNDSTIWNLSGVKTVIKEYIESRGSSFKGWLIRDSGYPQREEMLVPLLEFNTAKEM